MRSTRLIVTWFTLAQLAGLALAQSATQTRPSVDPAQWVPGEAVFYLGISDTEELWRDVQKTSGYKQLKDKELQDMPGMANPLALGAEKFKQRIATLLDVQPDALKNPFAGPLAIYVSAPRGATAEALETVALAAVGDTALMQEYLNAALGRLKARATNYEAVSAGPHTVHVLNTTPAEEKSEDDFDFEEEESGPGMTMGPDMGAMVDQALDELFSLETLPEHLALCLAGDRLIVAPTAEAVKRALAGDGERLADSDAHRMLLTSLKPVGQVRFLVNLPRIFELARAESTDEDQREMMKVLGADSLRSLVGHARIGTKSYELKVELLFLMSGERSGLAKLLSRPNATIDPPEWMSTDTSAFFSMNLEPNKLTDEILQMVAASDPESAEQARVWMEQLPLGEQTVNLRKDLIDHLAGPLTISLAMAQPAAADSLRALITLGHRNRDAVTRMLTQLLPGVGAPQDIRGTPVYPVPLPMLPVPFHLAISSDRVLFGNPKAVEGVLSGATAGGLAETAEFRRARRVVPKEAWLVFYFDQQKFMRGLIDLHKKLGADPSADPLAGGLLGALQMGGMDLSNEARNRKMLEYSSISIGTIATTPEGVQCTFVGLPTEGQDTGE